MSRTCDQTSHTLHCAGEWEASNVRGLRREIIDTFIKDSVRYRREPLWHDLNPSDVIVDHVATFC